MRGGSPLWADIPTFLVECTGLVTLDLSKDSVWPGVADKMGDWDLGVVGKVWFFVFFQM